MNEEACREAVRAVIELEKAELQMTALTGRRMAARHIARLQRFAARRPVSFPNVYREWRARTIAGVWGQTYRLRRLGIHV